MSDAGSSTDIIEVSLHMGEPCDYEGVGDWIRLCEDKLNTHVNRNLFDGQPWLDLLVCVGGDIVDYERKSNHQIAIFRSNRVYMRMQYPQAMIRLRPQLLVKHMIAIDMIQCVNNFVTKMTTKNVVFDREILVHRINLAKAEIFMMLQPRAN
jgi:hypothetical protein